MAGRVTPTMRRGWTQACRIAQTEKDHREFRQYLAQCTDAQVQGVYNKEKAAGRDVYAMLAIYEANRRGIRLETA